MILLKQNPEFPSTWLEDGKVPKILKSTHLFDCLSVSSMTSYNHIAWILRDTWGDGCEAYYYNDMESVK